MGFRVDCGAMRQIRSVSRIPQVQLLAACTLACIWPLTAVAHSMLTVGPRGVQALVLAELFNRSGRWYLIDDGDCYTYLESPQTRIAADRLVLRAHLSSRFGQQIGSRCVGTDIASNVTLSGRLRGRGHALVLEDIRIDRVDDEPARDAINVALSVDPQLIPNAADIDISEFARANLVASRGSFAHLDEFRIIGVTTRTDSIVIEFALRMSAP